MHATLPARLLLAALALPLLAAPLHATSGGPLGTLDRGAYVCEMPGDAASSRGVSAPEQNFSITNASTYSTADGRGTYLRTGDKVTITSGPKKGQRFEVKSENFLRELGKNGQPTGLRCIRLGATAS